MEMPCIGLGKTAFVEDQMAELAALGLSMTIIDPDEYMTPRFYLPVLRFAGPDEYKKYMESRPRDRSKEETLVFELRESTEAERQAWSEMFQKLTEEIKTKWL